jgi:Carboxypeptidase regulatory-like domain
MRSNTHHAFRFCGSAEVLVFVVMCFAQAQSQSAILAGIVKDISGAEVPKAEIELKANNGLFFRTATDSRGSFTIVSTPGEYSLTASSPGFAVFTKTVHLTASAPIIEQIELALSNCTNCVTVCDALCGLQPEPIQPLTEPLNLLLPIQPLPPFKFRPRSSKNLPVT